MLEINISSCLSEAGLFFKSAKGGAWVQMGRLWMVIQGCIHACAIHGTDGWNMVFTAFWEYVETQSHEIRVSLCKIHYSAFLASFSYYPNKAYMMKSPVTSLLSLLPLLASFSVSPLPKKWQRVQGVGKRCFVKCCEKANSTVCQSQSESPAVGDSIIYKKIQAYVIRGNLSLCLKMVIQKVYVIKPTNSGANRSCSSIYIVNH